MGQRSSKAELSTPFQVEPGVQDFGTFPCSYMGQCTVSSDQPSNAVIEGAQRILHARNPKIKALVNVSGLGLEVFEASGTGTVTATALLRMSYVSLIGRKQNLVAYLHRASESAHVCHLLRAKKSAPAITSAIRSAFESAKVTATQPARRRARSAWGNEMGVGRHINAGGSPARPRSATHRGCARQQQVLLLANGSSQDNGPAQQSQHQHQHSNDPGGDGERHGQRLQASAQPHRHRAEGRPVQGSKSAHIQNQSQEKQHKVKDGEEPVRSKHAESTDTTAQPCRTQEQKQQHGSKKERTLQLEASAAAASASAVTETPTDDALDISDAPAPEERTMFSCLYLGHTTVAHTAGEEEVAASVKDVVKANKPRKARLEITSQEVLIRDAKSGEVLQLAPVAEMTFYTISRKKKSLLSFVTCDRERITFCHTLRFKNARVCSRVGTAVGRAFVDASQRNRPKSAQPSSQASAFARHLTTSSLQRRDPASPLGLFEAQFLGTVPVEERRGHAVCESAALSLLLSKPAPTQVAISVSGEGIKVVEALTSEVFTSIPIKNITFTTVVNDKKILKKDKTKGVSKGDEALCVFINHDVRLSRTTCEVFRAGRRAPQVCEAISIAFTVALDQQKRQKNNAFAAVSSKRQPVKGPLFKRQIHRRDLRPIRVIGMGQFGEVYLSQQTVKAGRGEDGGNTVHRAVKLLRNGASVADRTEFLREAEVMLDLTHVNLVRMIGVAVQQRPWLYVLEYMQYGDLRSVLRTAHEKGLRLTFLESLKFAVQIATGMEYLSSLEYIHMDLAARNCLLGDKNLVKIADFGLTRKCKPGRDYYRLTTTLKLPIKWMAVESMEEKLFSTKSDVWAFGVTCWEIFSYGAVPYGCVRNLDVQERIKRGMRLSRPNACPKDFYNAVLRRCWIHEWRKRPSFTDLKRVIIRFARQAKETSPMLRDVGRALKVWNKTHEENQQRAIARAQRNAAARAGGKADASATEAEAEAEAGGSSGGVGGDGGNWYGEEQGEASTLADQQQRQQRHQQETGQEEVEGSAGDDDYDGERDGERDDEVVAEEEEKEEKEEKEEDGKTGEKEGGKAMVQVKPTADAQKREEGHGPGTGEVEVKENEQPRAVQAEAAGKQPAQQQQQQQQQQQMDGGLSAVDDQELDRPDASEHIGDEQEDEAESEGPETTANPWLQSAQAFRPAVLRLDVAHDDNTASETDLYSPSPSPSSEECEEHGHVDNADEDSQPKAVAVEVVVEDQRDGGDGHDEHSTPAPNGKHGPTSGDAAGDGDGDRDDGTLRLKSDAGCAGDKNNMDATHEKMAVKQLPREHGDNEQARTISFFCDTTLDAKVAEDDSLSADTTTPTDTYPTRVGRAIF